MECDISITVPDGIAVVKDGEGNTLATELIPSGESKDIIIEVEKAVIIEFDVNNFLIEYDITIGVDQVGDYTTETLTNVATVVYEINAVPTALPFTLADGDILNVIITRTIAEQSSTVKISTI